MRTLKLNGNDGRRYRCLYVAASAPTAGFAGERGRVLSRVLDKLETVGLVSSDRGDDASFTLTPMGGVIRLEETEYALLLERVRTCAWLPNSVREGIATEDWLAGIGIDVDVPAEHTPARS